MTSFDRETIRELYKQALLKENAIQLMNIIYTNIDKRIQDNIIDKELTVTRSEISEMISKWDPCLKNSLTMEQIMDKCSCHYQSIGMNVGGNYYTLILEWDHIVKDINM